MSEWKKVKLGDLATKITKGTTPSNIGESFCDRGIPFIRSELITQNKYISDVGLLYISKETHEKLKRSQLEANDILFSMAGVYLGKTAILRECDVPANTNQAVALIRLDPVLCNIGFIYYYLNQESVIRYVNQISGQAAQPNINLQQIGEIPIVIPSRKEQDSIATVLSRYDTLIENYQKQIKLLEEAVHRLYKEWFVDFRFPGYENAKMVDGLPEGWERKPVDSIYSIKYGKNLSTKLISENGEYPVYGANGVIGYYDKANCHEQVVLITSRGNGSGDVLMTYHKDAFITNNSFVVTPMDEYCHCQLTFTYHFLKNANFRSVRTGAAQPQLTNQSIHTVDVVLPSKELVIEYCKKTKHYNKKIISLKNQIRLLTEARDRLLPMLMGGEMELKEQM